MSSPRCQLIAELATNHGGNLDLLAQLIEAAAGAGADWIKLQAYDPTRLLDSDPHKAWLTQASLDPRSRAFPQAVSLIHAQRCQAMVSVFSPDIIPPGFDAYKLGHADSWRWRVFTHHPLKRWFYSWPWGRRPGTASELLGTHLATIPLYPAPLEALAGLTDWLDGYSDHTRGLEACQIAMARGAQFVEKHFSLPGRGRNQGWDMNVDGLKQLREWAEVCAVGLHGSRQFERWSR